MENIQEQRGRGRPKGSQNKFTKEIKDAFQAAFSALQDRGGVNLLDWAAQNPTEFYRITARMMPQNIELTGEDGGPIENKVI